MNDLQPVLKFLRKRKLMFFEIEGRTKKSRRNFVVVKYDKMRHVQSNLDAGVRQSTLMVRHAITNGCVTCKLYFPMKCGIKANIGT